MANVKQLCRLMNVDMNEFLLDGFQHVLDTAEKRDWPEAKDEDLSIEEQDD